MIYDHGGVTMEPTYTLYTLSSSASPHGVRYVGITKNAKQRLRGHLKAANDNTKVHHRANWIRSVLADGNEIVMNVLETGLSEGEAKRLEIATIARMRTDGIDLVNATDGGDGVRGYVFTPEARRKISLAGIGRRHKPESIERTAAAHRGKFVSAETRRRIAEAASNISDETRSKLAEAARNSSPEKREKIAKKVSQINRLNPPLRGGYKGVTYRADMRKWRARINPGTGERHIGWFPTPEEAARAYDAAALAAWGEGKCYINFPEAVANVA